MIKGFDTSRKEDTAAESKNGRGFLHFTEELPITNMLVITDTNMLAITVTNMSVITVTNMSAITGQI